MHDRARSLMRIPVGSYVDPSFSVLTRHYSQYMSSREIFQMRVPVGWHERVDEARGHEPKASFVKRAVELLLDSESPSEPRAPAPVAQAVRDLVGAQSVRKTVPEVAVGDAPLYRCRDHKCEWRAPSPAARCSKHPGPTRLV